ncbi:hypothetical protein Ccar_08120 [Clostridium carboxidivorans P7]|uniref:GOLD domain-containing protein n=1 Tax=Clostridium carboxidivorans P7 TaxID=536227 RepID=C6PWL0_9CLOT|nr:hypothetical protein [Clostridium carboxidivorans]AKN30806.1 hypothetical protein Ccar_08120 [Clostridium carboxidivorans P7]EET86363.1 conserved hypothetical protein [Clostridium carboxidivorans P7]EFG88485.1 hypothetical protein CLCAR_1701 [Clostridium carboxidivorans P7]
MDGGKEQELQELSEEIEIILSIKDDISKDEVENFKGKFLSLSEYDIRKKISEVTKNNIYLEEFEKTNINEKIEDNIEINNINDDEKIEKDTIKQQENSTKDLLVNNEVNVDEKLKEIEFESINENEKSKEEIKCEEITDKSEEKSIEIVDENNIPEISFVKAEVKYSQLSLEWAWDEKIDKVLICYRMDKFPVSPKDSAAFQVVVAREDNMKEGNYIINKVNEGNYYFSIYVMVNYNGKTLFSKAQRRLVVNKEPSEIFYEIKIKKNLFGKVKSAELLLSTDEKKLDLPQLVLIGKFGNIPIQKSDGEPIINIDYDSVTSEDLISFDIPIENLSKNMYVKLFFVDDSNSKLYRIVSPSKENLHFK